MRKSIPLTLALLAACSRSPEAAPVPQPSATPAAATPSPAALQAKAVAQRYFDLLRAHRYADAYRLWGSSAASNGTLAAFTQAQQLYAAYDGTAGNPSTIHPSDGQDYVTVESEVHVSLASGKRSTRSGVVMLKRPAARGGSPADAWEIWGVDLRDRHCRPGEKQLGLGCVAVK